MQKEKMMCKKTPLFILLLIGYLCNSMAVATDTTTSPSQSLLTEAPKATLAADATTSPSESLLTEAPETTPSGRDHVPEKGLTAVIVAGISISLVLLFILVIIGVWYARKKSMAEMNSVPSGEPGVFLERISTRENQQEWPFERELP